MFVCVCLYVCTYTVIVMVEGGVASLCGTQSREQVGSGWSRESVLIVFVPQSCLAVVKAASTSWEANCSIYTGRRFLFFFFLSIYLFYNGECMYNLQCHTGFIHSLCQIAKITERQLWRESQTRPKLVLFASAEVFFVLSTKKGCRFSPFDI